MMVSVEQAREFFADPSQQIGGLRPDELPEDGFDYLASGPICGVFHDTMWPGVYMGHYGAKPEGRGNLDGNAILVLEEFWDIRAPKRIIGWTPRSNKPALAFAKRLGFVTDGVMPLGDEEIEMFGWSKWQ